MAERRVQRSGVETRPPLRNMPPWQVRPMVARGGSTAASFQASANRSHAIKGNVKRVQLDQGNIPYPFGHIASPADRCSMVPRISELPEGATARRASTLEANMIIARSRRSGWLHERVFPFRSSSMLQLSTSTTQFITRLVRRNSPVSGATMCVALLLIVVSSWPHARAEALAIGNGPSSCPASAPPNASAHHLYVSTTGSDAESGSANAPFLTIQRATSAAAAGTTIHVGPGTYKETITSIASGTPSMPIRYVSEPRGAAVIRPSGATDTI